ARRSDRAPPRGRARHVVRRAGRGVLRDAAGRAAARPHGRGVRHRPAARDGRALRAWIRLRHPARGRLLPDRLPGTAVRSGRDLRTERRGHARVPRAGARRPRRLSTGSGTASGSRAEMSATSGAMRALLIYAVAALAMTWPLAADLT